MAIIVRIVSADGKKAISQVLPGLPAKLKVPAGAKVEVTDKETGQTMSLAQYINSQDARGEKGEGSHHGAAVTVEPAADWNDAQAWLDSLGQLSPSSEVGSTQQWFATEAKESGGKVFGFDQMALGLGGLAGAGAVAAAVGGGGGGGGGSKDTIAPAPPQLLDLAAADDTGTSSTDNITSKTSELTITGTAEAGSSVELFNGSTSLGKVDVGTNGIFTLDISLSSGDHNITARATDAAGNTGSASSALKITIDTTAPAAATGLDLATADDTGESSTDNVTRLTTGLTISGTAEAGAKVELFAGTISLGTATVANNGTFSIDVSLPAGTHSITAKVTDVAGNTGTDSAPLVLVVDTTPPPAPSGLDLADEDDTGISNTDNITTKTSGLTITGTADPGALIELFDGSTSIGTVTANANGTFLIDLNLGAGAHTITAVTRDAAGNTATSAPLTIQVDTSAPNVPTQIDLAGDDDTGLLGNDNVTNKTNSLTITGLSQVGTTVELFDGTTSLGTATAASNGTFTFDISLAEGTHALTVKATDAAGNVSNASSVLNVTVDTTAPAAPTQLDLAADDDTGVSDTDNITTKTSGLTITGRAEAGARVELFNGSTSLGTVTADANGNFTKDISLTVGTHQISAQATDVAGNIGAPSAALAITVLAQEPAAGLLSADSHAMDVNPYDHAALIDPIGLHLSTSEFG